MNNENVIYRLSKQFALQIVELYSILCNEKKEYVMSKQLYRSGTSIGANIAEAQYAQTKADFVTKMHISLKEANETKYWLRLLYATNYIDDSCQSFMDDCDELLRLLTATCKTTKQ